MHKFQIHTIETAPEHSRSALRGLQKAFGFIPNAAATMAGNPMLINAFVGAFGSFAGGTLNDVEKQTLLLTNAVALKCHWTVAFHSTVASKVGVLADDVSAIRAGRLPSDAKLAALSALAKSLTEKRGHDANIEVEKFVAAGYSPTQVLEVIAGVAISTMAALTTNLANTPVEGPLQAQA
ncbi:MAG TPA: carboxymuconolactone decarboxylase family protein [Steroidobacteraceae bacterium]|nr:carboxymuconolactone decarboxylase family protein [Steroidobacteraceae bacterium]